MPTRVAIPAERPVVAELPKLDISAVVPCYNEAESVDLAYERITRELERYGDVEVIFVDDGSTDATLERVRALAAADQRVKYLSFARNFGQEAAFSAGFKYAAKPWTVQFDADLQWPPEEVHKLLARTAEGYDVVFGIRERRRDPWFRRLGAAASQWVARAWLGIEVPMGASAFRVVRSSVAKKIVALRLDTPYFIATVPRVGARYTSVPIVHHPRLHGVSKWSVRKLAVHALELLFGFSLRPIALAYLFSVAAVLLGLVHAHEAGTRMLFGLSAACYAAAALLGAGFASGSRSSSTLTPSSSTSRLATLPTQLSKVLNDSSTRSPRPSSYQVRKGLSPWRPAWRSARPLKL